MADEQQDQNADGSEQDELGLDDFHSAPAEEGLSLEALSDAYAGLIEQGGDPYEASRQQVEGDAPALAEDGVEDVEDDFDEADEYCEVSPQSILEAMLFVGNAQNEPLAAKVVASLMRGVRAQEIEGFVEELNGIYRAEGCPYAVVAKGEGYLLELRPDYAPLRDKFYGRVKESKLSQQAVDVLAIVAYRQPLTREDVDDLRGKPSGGVLSQLVRRQLLRIERTEKRPRRTTYHTTDRFLDLFRLESLAELPQSQEMDKNL